MSITELRAFHQVALAGGFSQAAREMAVSQSTLSGHVRQLEARCHKNLFERHSRGVELTRDGQVLLEVTTRLFSAEDEAQGFIRGDPLRKGGYLRVAAVGAFWAVPTLAALERERPDMTFSLRIENSYSVIDQILRHQADVGITARMVEDPRLYSREIRNTMLDLYVRHDHPLATAGQATLRDLQGERLILREVGSRTREVIEKNLSSANVRVAAALEVSTREGVVAAVAAGMGVTLMAHEEMKYDIRLARLPITGAKHFLQEYVICLMERRNQPLIRAFVREALAEPRRNREEKLFCPMTVPFPGVGAES